jgi:cytochrome c-type biogenesis protein CcmH/NrfG
MRNRGSSQFIAERPIGPRKVVVRRRYKSPAFLEQFRSNLLDASMNDTLTEKRPRSATTTIIMLLVLAALSLVVILVWQNIGWPASGVHPELSAQHSDETKPVAMEQTVKDLQASLQQTADQLTEIKRELAAEQGERKLLSEQVGALAGRIDSLAVAPTSSVAPGGRKRTR